MRFPPVLPSLLLLVYLLGGIYLFIEIRGEQVDGLLLFSAVKGRVLDHGRPVVGVQIERETSWNMEDETRREYTSTDSEGRFIFPEMRGSGRFGLIERLQMPIVSQTISILSGGESIVTYAHLRMDYTPNQETGFEQIQFECDMSTLHVIDELLKALDCHVYKKDQKVE